MSRIDVYLRSIKQLGALGAVLTSGQAVTLRFPTGDRHATQITAHDQLVSLVREIAPPAVLDQIDRARPASFELEASGGRWSIQVAPRPGAWHVAIDPVDGAASPSASPSSSSQVAPPSGPPMRPTPRPATVAPGGGEASEMAIERSETGGGDPDGFAGGAGGRAPRGIERSETGGGDPDGFAGGAGGRASRGIERGPYGAPTSGHTTSSGSALLDHLTAGGRAAYASDIYLNAGTPAFQRIGGELTATADRALIDGDTLARELGLVAPNEARGAWAERGLAVFAYGDGAGRVRVTLTRDHRGPGATLRLLPAEAPPLAGLGLDGVTDWLRDRGLVIVAGPSGCGKTTALAALVRALGEQRRRVVTIEDPIELVHVSGWISQRAIGDHVPGVADGVAAAMREGADAIAIGAVHSAADAAAVIEAVAGGHLVLTTVTAPRAGVAVHRLLDRLSPEQRETARTLCEDAYLGTIGPIVTRAGRSFEVAAGRRRTS